MYENIDNLIKKSQNGDKKSLEKLIEINKGLIWGIVRKFSYRNVEQEDLYQIACIGFIKSVRRFDFSYNVKLSTYSSEYILGEIKKFIRDDGIIKVSRNIKELGIKINQIKKIYGETISLNDISKILGITEEEVNEAMNALKNVESINEEIYDNNLTQKIEKISSDYNNEEVIVDKVFVSDLLEKLKYRDKKVITLRYYKCKTQMQVAKIMGISQVQVSRIERKALKNLRNELKEEAII